MSAGDQFGFLEAGGISVDLAGIPGMSQYRPTVQLYDLSTVSDCDLCILLRRHRQVTVRSPVSHIRDLRSLSTARHTRKVIDLVVSILDGGVSVLYPGGVQTHLGFFGCSVIFSTSRTSIHEV